MDQPRRRRAVRFDPVLPMAAGLFKSIGQQRRLEVKERGALTIELEVFTERADKQGAVRIGAY